MIVALAELLYQYLVILVRDISLPWGLLFCEVSGFYHKGKLALARKGRMFNNKSRQTDK